MPSTLPRHTRLELSLLGRLVLPGRHRLRPRFLAHYASEFATVELDTTFYAIPRLSTIAGWRERTPAGFRFAAKFPQAITHEKGLVNCADDALAFVDAMSSLDQKLGPLLLQMPPSWGAGALDTLTSFLPNSAEPASAMRWKCGIAHGWRRTRCPSSWGCSRSTRSRSAWCSTRGCPPWTRSPRRSSTSAGWAAARTSPTTTSRTCASIGTPSSIAGRSRSRAICRPA